MHMLRRDCACAQSRQSIRISTGPYSDIVDFSTLAQGIQNTLRMPVDYSGHAKFPYS